MIKRNIRIIPIFIGATFLIIMFGLLISTVLETLDNVSTGNIEIRKTPDPLNSELSNTISLYKNGEIGVIDLSTVTIFSWDRLYMFEDYTSPAEMDSAIGRSWRKNCYTQISSSDGYTLLVFVFENVVVHCLDYSKDEGDFLIPEKAYKEGLSFEESLFVMNEYDELVWLGDN